MSGEQFAMIGCCGMFPGLILVAVAVKYWEIRQASRWPATPGKVVASQVKSRSKQQGDMGYNESDTNLENYPFVEYEFEVNGKKYRSSRYTIGEKTSDYELEDILNRHPVGTAVTVYYDPTNPKNAVLERTFPTWVFAAMGGLIAFFVAAPLFAWWLYAYVVDWIRPHLANPRNAPFVTAVGGFATAVALFALAYTRMIYAAKRWPTTKGKVVTSNVEEYYDSHSDGPSSCKMYRANVIYEYTVNGRTLRGDRVRLGARSAASYPGLAEREVAKYPVGMVVKVYYDPRRPSDSLLRPHSLSYLLIWIVVLILAALLWAVATGRLGKGN